MLIGYDKAVPASPTPALSAVLESAARLQRLVPDAVLVGGTAAAFYAGHRESMIHDHVLADLAERFDVVLEALEREGDWLTNRVTPGKIILGQIGDIEAGVRQLIRRSPLEVADVVLPSGASVRVPTADETLRIKGFLIVKRNQVRDFLDVAALTARAGVPHAARVLARIDAYYADQRGEGDGVASQLVRQLGDPRPADQRTIADLDHYKGLQAPWTDWKNVTATCQAIADAMVSAEPSR